MIDIVSFNYKDTIRYKDSFKTGVIAQEVETVYPQCITENKDYIPDIYKIYEIIESKEHTIRISSPFNDVKLHTKIKMFSKTKEILGFISYKDDISWIITHHESEIILDNDIFVWGTEVNDFKTVDYNELFSLNISATQGLYTMIKKQDNEIDTLKRDLQDMKDILKRAGLY